MVARDVRRTASRLGALAVLTVALWLAIAGALAGSASASPAHSRVHATNVAARHSVIPRPARLRDSASDAAVALVGVGALVGVLLVGGGMFLRVGRRREVHA